MPDLIQRLQRNLERQNAALKQTLNEIEHVKQVAPHASQLIAQLIIRRDRQSNNAQATQQHIDILNTPITSKRK